MRFTKSTIITLLVGLSIIASVPDFLESQEKPLQRRGSKLGGYEKPPPANDVPSHLFDIVLGRPTNRAVTARIVAYESLEGRIIYGAESGVYTSETALQQMKQGEPVDFVIDKLSADSRAYYRFEYRHRRDELFEKTEEYSVHTQRSPKSSFAFTVQADSHLDENTSPSVYELTLANALACGPDFHVELGDTFMTDKYVRPELSIGQYLAQRYYFGQLCHSAPLFFVLGNHDGEMGDRGSNVWATQTRKKFFPNPSPNDFYSGNRSQEPSIGVVENYYSWTWGNSLFIVLDPFRYSSKPRRKREGGQRDDEKNDHWNLSLGRTQYDWLNSTLKASKSKFKFVFLHHLVGGADQNRGGVEAAPLFEWGGKGVDGTDEFNRMRPGWGQPIHRMLVDHNVTIVFHGHDHLFVKQDLDHIVYQEVPQPGHPRFGNIRSAAEYGYLSGEIQSSSGHLRINVASDSVRVDYVRTYLADQESPARKNGDVSYTYLIQ